MRHLHRADANQDEIIKALRRCGCSVLSLTSIGHGCPDLLVGIGHRNVLLEVKSAKGQLNRMQAAWRLAWNGPIAIAHTAEEAIDALGLRHIAQQALL